MLACKKKDDIVLYSFSLDFSTVKPRNDENNTRIINCPTEPKIAFSVKIVSSLIRNRFSKIVEKGVDGNMKILS